MILNCDMCNKEFYTKPSRIKDGRGKHCSKACYYIFRKGVRVSVKTEFKKGLLPWNTGSSIGKTLACLRCGKDFYVVPSYLAKFNAKYCSKVCQRVNKKCIDCGVTINNVSLRCRCCANTGQLSPAWRGGVTPLYKKIVQSEEYKTWRTAVFKRDNYTCQLCGQRGCQLQADHINSFAFFPELRFELSNGRTLCVECHRTTPNYGMKAKLVGREVMYYV